MNFFFLPGKSLKQSLSWDGGLCYEKWQQSPAPGGRQTFPAGLLGCGAAGHGEEKESRQYVLCSLPHITTLDFREPPKTDTTTAEVWKCMSIREDAPRISLRSRASRTVSLA